MTESDNRYEWKPVEDLPSDWPEMVVAELSHLSSIWKEQSARLETSESLKEFNERLAREWAIETGIIEGLYTIDRGTTQLLIEKGIEANLIVHGTTDEPPERVARIVSVQKDALDGIFDFVASRRPLSTSYIKELHQAMTRFQETVSGVDQFGNRVEPKLIRGDWKKLPNNPMRPDAYIHEYCPPEHVAAEMDRLIEMHTVHATDNVAPEVESAWLHHRFTQIHPFQDGNGRIARALASLVFLRDGYFPLVVTREDRSEYVDALEKADKGNLFDLVDLFVRIEKKAFVRALSLSESVLKDHVPVRDVVASAVDRLRARFEAGEESKKEVFKHAQRLKEIAESQLAEVASTLEAGLRGIEGGYQALIMSSTDENDFWFRRQIVEIAKGLGYFADTRTYREWVRLSIREERTADLVVTLHSLGFDFTGILVATAFLEYRQTEEDGKTATDGLRALCEEPFEFSYFDEPQRLEARFRKWLNDVILMGLDDWRRQL